MIPILTLGATLQFHNVFSSHAHHDEEVEQESCMGAGPCAGLNKVRTVAWVIVVGDGFCNVVDGLTSAASFSVSISKGITVMLAVFMQELPHRIGDYAVLVNAGMTPFQVRVLFVTQYLIVCLSIGDSVQSLVNGNGVLGLFDGATFAR